MKVMSTCSRSTGSGSEVIPEKCSEAELVERAKRDPAAFGELYNFYYSRILNYIYRRILDVDTAEELTSNTFFKALKALPKYRRRSSFRAWIYRIATNEIKMFWRSGKNRALREKKYQNINQADQVFFISAEVESRQERQEKLRLFCSLHEFLDELPEKYRTVLVLKFFEGLKYDEIQTVTGKRVGTLKSLVHRGLKRLRVILEERNATFCRQMHYHI